MSYKYKNKIMKKIFLGLSIVSVMLISVSMTDTNIVNNEITNSLTNQKTVTRKVASFEKLIVSSAITVNIVEGNFDGKITISAPENVLEYIRTDVSNNTLEIGIKSTNGIRFKNNEKIEITIPHNKLRALKMSGATNLTANHSMKVEEFKLDLSGASKVNLNLVANKIEANVSGASNVNLNGNVQNFDIEASGASKLDAFSLKANSIDFEVSGASSVKIWAVNNLKGTASGASSINYKEGKSLNKDVKTSGASSVKVAK